MSVLSWIRASLIRCLRSRMIIPLTHELALECRNRPTVSIVVASCRCMVIIGLRKNIRIDVIALVATQMLRIWSLHVPPGMCYRLHLATTLVIQVVIAAGVDHRRSWTKWVPFLAVIITALVVLYRIRHVGLGAIDRSVGTNGHSVASVLSEPHLLLLHTRGRGRSSLRIIFFLLLFIIISTVCAREARTLWDGCRSCIGTCVIGRR